MCGHVGASAVRGQEPGKSPGEEKGALRKQSEESNTTQVTKETTRTERYKWGKDMESLGAGEAQGGIEEN